jgi:YrbI family 3-deoxy-D-manno-octulosonate 8-phosphate phosphatase
VLEDDALNLAVAEALAGWRTTWAADRLQGLVRQGEPLLRAARRGGRAGGGAAAAGAGARASGLPLLTDVHAPAQCAPAAEVADVLQIPAFLCRQTDLLEAAGATGRPVNVKKGQWMAPGEMAGAADKVRAGRGRRGGGDGAGDLLRLRRPGGGHALLRADARGVRGAGGVRRHPLGAAAGGGGGVSGGEPRFIPPLVRAAVAAGADALFLEVHPEPARAPSDATNMLPLERLRPLLEEVLALRAALGMPEGPRVSDGPPPIDRALARRIRMVVLDVDGVLTDGGIYLGATASGEAVELKRFDIQDGLGVLMMRNAGLKVAIVTGRVSEAVRLRAEELGVDDLHQDRTADKLNAVSAILERNGIDWDETAFVGDDLPDLVVLRRVALPAVVGNATSDARACAVWHGRRRGGHGAVREFAEALLTARGEWAGAVEAYVREREAAA